jgi:ATP-dependent protease ClpP protease subunit
MKMPKTINVKGVIVSDSDAWIYDWFGIENASPGSIEKQLAEADGDDIIVRINSNGGDVFAGSEIYDLLADYSGNLLIRIVGMAASAASVIACAGQSEIAPTGMMMIHNVQSSTYGDYRDMEHSAVTLKEANRAIMAAYRAKTKLSEKELLSLMDKETYISADMAVEKGFVDKISDYGKENSLDSGVQLAASMTGLLPAATIRKFRAERAKAQAQLDLINLMEE